MNTNQSGQSKNAVIIGGGINGLCTAYYLQKKNFEVTVIDSGDITNNCSFGNMGFLSPSHFIPLASPGIVSEGLKHLLSKTSPFYIKPRLNYSFLRWALKFYNSSTQKMVEKNGPPLEELLNLSKRLMNEIREDIGDSFLMEEIGCMMMCHSKKAFEAELKVAEASRRYNLDIEILERQELQQREPDVELDIYGAVLFRDDAHIHPGKFMLAMKDYLQKNGVDFQFNTQVSGFEKKGQKILKVVTNRGSFDAAEVIITAGAWLPKLANLLEIDLLLEGGKGYSYTYQYVEKNIKYPAILVDGRCAITPWKHTLRIGGTMEFSGLNENILVNRMEGIYNSVKKFYPGLNIDFPPHDKIWTGLRPVTPDGLPYIGRPDGWKNVAFGGGHAMLGISAGAGTGLILSDLLAGEQAPIDIKAFDVERF